MSKSHISSVDYRHTKIIATLGPATESKDRISQLIRSGVDVVRLNMAHATRQWVADTVWHVREVCTNVERHVAVMMDVKGPEIRTGPLDIPIELQRGQILELFTESASPDRRADASVSVNYSGLPQDVDLGTTLLVDSGLLRFRTVDKDDARLFCEVLTPGTLGSRRHINLPGVQVRLPAITEKDQLDLRAGVQAGLDFVALSFVRHASDIETLRRFLEQLGSRARIIAKIEDQAGVDNMTDIVRAADAIMVARGDLGIEIDYHRLPLVQSQLVEECRKDGKPVIIATHLLESMIYSPMPTRAEISDVSNAIREQVDAVMLSGETTTGAYPLEAVDVMKNVISSIEPTVSKQLNTDIELREPKAMMLRASATLAQELDAGGIIVFTRSGFLAYVLGALRARGIPIFAFTDDEITFRQLLLPWGVEPFLMPFSDDPEATIRDAICCLKRTQWCGEGDWLVVITNALADDRIIDTMQLRQIE